jgi:hypothetical protein
MKPANYSQTNKTTRKPRKLSRPGKWQARSSKKELELMNTKEKIEVMQAFIDGKEIQEQSGGNSEWRNCHEPSWDWFSREYRIKPQPREWTMAIKDGVLMSLLPVGYPVPYNDGQEVFRVREVIDE